MTIDELFALRGLMLDVLCAKLKAKRAELKRRFSISRRAYRAAEVSQSLVTYSDAELIADRRQGGCWMDRLLAALCRLR
ncbi:hypothetical protein CQ13_09630 [Bradyrhizobium retamae]|uniref:Transposase n=1 Tax=Bradyrhizobium retamae TaxID=1300035 RepID=A0A0R3MF65_9BRAD|nr:hypothetical protein CQ13_09630 [Bradyrhizobium retamae]